MWLWSLCNVLPLVCVFICVWRCSSQHGSVVSCRLRSLCKSKFISKLSSLTDNWLIFFVFGNLWRIPQINSSPTAPANANKPNPPRQFYSHFTRMMAAVSFCLPGIKGALPERTWNQTKYRACDIPTQNPGKWCCSVISGRTTRQRR